MLTNLQIAERLQRFAEDEVAGAKWIALHIDEFSEPQTLDLVRLMVKGWGNIEHPETKKILWPVLGLTEEGRKFMYEVLRDRGVSVMTMLYQCGMSDETARKMVLTWLEQAKRMHLMMK